MELGTRRHCLNHDQSVLGIYFRWLGATPKHPVGPAGRAQKRRPTQRLGTVALAPSEFRAQSPKAPPPALTPPPAAGAGTPSPGKRDAQLYSSPRLRSPCEPTPSSQVARGPGEGHAACNLPRRWAPLATRVGVERSPRPPQAGQGRAQAADRSHILSDARDGSRGGARLPRRSCPSPNPGR